MRQSRVDMLGTLQVCDAGESPAPGNIAAYLTPEGYLAVEGQISGVGVYEYSDGKDTWGELRMPDHVFAPESMQTFAGKPVTDDHPPEFVKVDNWSTYARGNLGSKIRPNDARTHVVADMLITDADLIEKIKGGKCQLSNGYEVVLIEAPGVLDGKAYQFVQTQITGNHNAVVDVARGGPDCRLLTDRADAVCYSGITMSEKKKTVADALKEIVAGTKKDATITFADGSMYPIPDDQAMQVVAALSQVQPSPEMAQAAPPAPAPAPAAPAPAPDAVGEEAPPEMNPEEEEKKQNAADSTGAKAEAQRQAQADAARAFALNVDARFELTRNADALGLPTRGLDDLSIKRAIISKVHGDKSEIAVKANADKTGHYVDAAYDAAIDAHKRANAQSLLAGTFRASANADGEDDLDKALRAHYGA